jgi:hypothetical protein
VTENQVFSEGALPTVIIIGVMKSGTSSLHNYLGQHPSVQMSMPKELNYFVSDDDDPMVKGVEGRNFAKGLDWYVEHFNAQIPVRGESSPAYMDPGHHGVAKRMAELIPNATLIVLTRDRFDRAVSHYRHEVAQGREHRPIDVALRDPTSPYVAMSRYHDCLVPFYEHFSSGQIIRYTQADLDLRRYEVVFNLFERLGVETTVTIENLEYRFNTTEGRQSALHRVLRFGRGSKLRSLVARSLPKSLRYQIDLRSRAMKMDSSQALGLEIDALADPLRTSFDALVRDDVEQFNLDFSEGRIVEGIANSSERVA